MDPNLLINVLNQCKEQASQLTAYLKEYPFHPQLCELLAQQIHSTLQTAIFMTGQNPGSDMESRQREEFELPASGFKDLMYQRELCKKRKSLPKWNKEVRVSSEGGGIEGPLDDGHSWRKYGQKDILGAKHPRAYYRCSHRNSQGCLATKQVQRSDADPSIFNVAYRGDHICTKKRQKVQISRSSFKSNDASYPSNPDSNIFDSASMLENQFKDTFLSNTVSANNSAQNYYSLSANLPNNSEVELTEIISAPSSTIDSPTLNFDFMLSPGEFDPNFKYDCSYFF